MTYNVITQNNLTITKWLISLCNLSSRFPKSPEKKVALSRFTILLVGLPYIGWYHVNHYVQKRIECWHRCVESMFYLFQSDWTKIGGVSLICDPAYFCAHDPFWAYLLTLSYYNLETEAWVPQPYIYSEFWARNNSVGTSQTKNSPWKFLVKAVF